jgi:hypothetical protein
VDQTANLALPYIMPTQAQKHITHNVALARLDAIVQLSVLDRDLTAPPGSPADSDRYIVAASATGAWSGWDLSVAAFIEGAWTQLEPQPGWLCWVADEALLVAWDGAGWTLAGATDELQEITRFGLDATADGTNPFTAELNAALWTAKYAADGGSGDLRLTLNKEAAGDVAALLLHDGNSGRAEIGLVGNDDLSLRVSPDGSTWTDAIIADKDDGKVRFPAGMVHPASGARMLGFLPTPGGDGTVSVWRSDTARTDNPRTATISSVSGDTITLTTSDAQLFGRFTGAMANCAYVRIWKASKSPEQSAWVMASASSTTLKVLSAAAIATWSNGETVRLGDPVGIAPTPAFAIDISPMLQNVLGAVFRQAGVLAKIIALGSGSSGVTVSISEAAVSGSLMSVKSFPDGTQQNGQVMIPCSVLSPISNSNLMFVREQGNLSIGAISIVGVYV